MPEFNFPSPKILMKLINKCENGHEIVYGGIYVAIKINNNSVLFEIILRDVAEIWESRKA